MSSTYPVIKGSLLSTGNYTWNTADSVGRGASAVVYLGRHKSKGTVVAVKVFHDHVAMGYKQDDLRELELLRTLDHCNIIRLLAIETEQTSHKTVLVTEYCEGGSLHQMLDQPLYYYGLPEAEYKLVLFHVASGMQYLRERNVIHRDIKPGNIMRSITQEGFSIYKLTDFGAARNLDEDESFHSLYGTEEYLYPKVYERAVLKMPSRQSFDARVDLWSLGVTFYHTATGELPFQPYGGRQNRETMYQIITRKERGVISGVQTFQNGPIQWRKNLLETSPLSSGLRSLIVPILARLMEPDESSMISYEEFFNVVSDLKERRSIDVFHFGQCKDLKVYAPPNTTLSGLQDLIASLTDISASDQILLVGGRALEELVEPTCPLSQYPPHLLHDSLFLFHKDMSEAARLPRPDIPAFPEFNAYSDMDSDARLAHSCAARGELIKRFQKGSCSQQQCLMNGLLYFRIYVENRLSATKLSHEFMQQLMTECELHVKTFFMMSAMMKDIITASRGAGNPDVATLDGILKDTVIRQVHKKAAERIIEIEQYREVLIKRLDDVKTLASKVTGGCREEQCPEKVSHHMSVISAVQSRFRRDKSVKHQMTKHDENIHQFERQKLQMHCVTMKSIFTDHCTGQLEKVYKNSLQVCESLTRCLTRVMKVEKNINSVLNCQRLLSEKLIRLVETLSSLKSVDSGFVSGKASAPPTSLSSAGNRTGGVGSFALQTSLSDSVVGVSSQTQELSQKLEDLRESLDTNTQLIRNLEDTPLQSSGSLSRRIDATNTALAEFSDNSHHRVRPYSAVGTFDLSPLNPTLYGSSFLDPSMHGLPQLSAFSSNVTYISPESALVPSQSPSQSAVTYLSTDASQAAPQGLAQTAQPLAYLSPESVLAKNITFRASSRQQYSNGPSGSHEVEQGYEPTGPLAASFRTSSPGQVSPSYIPQVSPTSGAASISALPFTGALVGEAALSRTFPANGVTDHQRDLNGVPQDNITSAGFPAATDVSAMEDNQTQGPVEYKDDAFIFAPINVRHSSPVQNIEKDRTQLETAYGMSRDKT